MGQVIRVRGDELVLSWKESELFGWEPFLTDRDKELHTVRPRMGATEFGNRPALLLVDFYYASVGLERLPLLEAVKRWPASCGLEGWAAIDRTAELIEIARRVKIPVIHICRLSGFPSWGSRRNRQQGSEPELREHSKLEEIVAEVAPIPGELVLPKSAPSAFQGTPLIFELMSRGIDTVIVCGESTSGCVRATVVDACTEGLRVGVVAECCYDRTEASHYINLFDMNEKYANVIHAEDAARYLEGSSSIW